MVSRINIMNRILKKLIVIFCLTANTTCFASDITVLIDNVNIEFDVPPIIMNDRTMVPMRKIFEELGCTVEWLNDTQTVIATQNSKLIALQIGKNKIICMDMETGLSEIYEIDVAPIIHNDRTLVPIRIISESLGYSVVWNGQEQKIIIST